MAITAGGFGIWGWRHGVVSLVAGLSLLMLGSVIPSGPLGAAASAPAAALPMQAGVVPDQAATSAVALTPVGDGSDNAFYRGFDGAVFQRTFRDGTWSAESSIGGRITGAPSAAVSGSTLVVAARGTDNALWLRIRQGGSWIPWFTVGGVITEAPAVALGVDARTGIQGRIDVYARGLENALWTRNFVPGRGWSAWGILGGILRSGPATAGGGAVYVVGLDGGLWATTRNAQADTWGAWSPLGGQTHSTPAAAKGPSGGDWVFVRGTDNALWGRIDGRWHNLGGGLIDSPAATATLTGIDVVVRGGDAALWSALYRSGAGVTYRDSAWSVWMVGWAPTDPSSMYCNDSTPSNAAGYQAAFDGMRSANIAGWIGTDGGFPVTLADGRVVWLFGDTLIGSPPTVRDLANNGFVVQQGACFRPLTEPIPDPAPGEFVWPTGAVQQGSTLLVVGFHMRKGGDPPFDFQLVNIDVALFSLPALTLQSVTDLPLPTSPTYGENLLVEGQYVYAYGQTREPVANNFPIPRHYVARAPLGGVLDASAWRFWQSVAPGQDPWTSNNAQDADPMLFDNSETGGPLSVFSVGFNGSYVGSAFPIDVFSTDTIVTWSGASAGGPWTRRPIPAVTGVNNWYGQLGFPTRFAYGGRVTFNVAGGPIAQWSTNHESLDAVLADPNYYKVWFATPAPGSIP